MLMVNGGMWMVCWVLFELTRGSGAHRNKSALVFCLILMFYQLNEYKTQTDGKTQWEEWPNLLWKIQRYDRLFSTANSKSTGKLVWYLLHPSRSCRLHIFVIIFHLWSKKFAITLIFLHFSLVSYNHDETAPCTTTTQLN
jgi:hypothetical protein